MSASPRRATAEPPSGTALPFAENENDVLVTPPALWVVKLQSMAVGSNPLALTIPVPSIVRVFAVCVTTVDERRSKVKAPTLHRPGVGVDELNIQGALKVAPVFIGIPEKSPVLPASTWVLIQATTVVAVSKEFVSNWAEPPNWMLPFIALVAEMTGGRGWRVALALWLNANITVQKERIASFFVGTVFTFITNRVTQ
jgi:hypothetical protein